MTGNYITEAVGTALTVDGVDGSYWITTALIGRYDGGNPVTLVFPGMLLATRQWVLDLPQGPGGGTVDQTARDAAAAAQTDADAAGSVASAAAGAASTAQGTADSAQTDANAAQTTADTGVTNAATAQTDIDEHEAEHPAPGTQVFVSTGEPSGGEYQLDDVWIRDVTTSPWQIYLWDGDDWRVDLHQSGPHGGASCQRGQGVCNHRE